LSRAQTVSKARRQNHYLFITHILPKGLGVNKAVIFGKDVNEVNKLQILERKHNQVNAAFDN